MIDELTRIIDDMLTNLDNGEYEDCNGPWEREALYDIERHPDFKTVASSLKTPDKNVCSNDILTLIKYVHGKRGKNNA